MAKTKTAPTAIESGGGPEVRRASEPRRESNVPPPEQEVNTAVVLVMLGIMVAYLGAILVLLERL